MPNLELSDFIINTSYRLFGRWVPNIPSLKIEYYKSGLTTNYESYLTLAAFAALSSFVLSFVISLSLEVLFSIPILQAAEGAVVLSFVAVMVTLSCFIARPVLKARHNKSEIDSNLIYTVGYMSVLSAGGVPIERIFDRVIEVERRKAIKDLAIRFATNVKIFGSDVASSLNDIKKRSASDVFSKLITGIINTSKTSGDLKSLLVFETSNLLALKREQLKKRLTSMIALSELYITAMVMAPVTFILMITLLSVLGNSSISMSPIAQLNLIVFFGIPVLCIVFIVILDGALPKED